MRSSLGVINLLIIGMVFNYDYYLLVLGLLLFLFLIITCAWVCEYKVYPSISKKFINILPRAVFDYDE